VTALHVTHHRDDARRLAHRILVIDHGAVRESNASHHQLLRST
jgi:ABC-type thiamine transport system ATPase subunit